MTILSHLRFQPCRIQQSDRVEQNSFFHLGNISDDRCCFPKRFRRNRKRNIENRKSTSRIAADPAGLANVMCFLVVMQRENSFSKGVFPHWFFRLRATPHKHYAASFRTGQRLNQVHQKPQQHNCIIAAGFSVTVAVGIFLGRFAQADGSGNRLVQQNCV